VLDRPPSAERLAAQRNGIEPHRQLLNAWLG
jgi:hypothetical protein